MLAIASTVPDELETESRASNRWAVAGVALGIVAVTFYTLGSHVSELFFLRSLATTCGLAGIVLSSKAYFDARENGSYSRMASVGIALNGVFLFAGFLLAGIQSLLRLPLALPFAWLAVRRLKLYRPLKAGVLAWVPGGKVESEIAADEATTEQSAVLSPEDYQRLAKTGLYFGIAASALILAPTYFLLQNVLPSFWDLVWLWSIRLAFLCHVVGVWFCGLAFLQLLQRDGVSKTVIAGFVANVALAALLLAVALSALVWTVR